MGAFPSEGFQQLLSYKFEAIKTKLNLIGNWLVKLRTDHVITFSLKISLLQKSEFLKLGQ